MKPEGEAKSENGVVQGMGGAAVHMARRAISGVKSGLFELQGATGESGKVR